MRVRKAIKKIAALAAGATMLGATLMGAMAADLANYPAPFVEECSFAGAIVIGAAAAAEDVVGAVDIASSLAVSGTTTTSTGAVSATGESVAVETSTNKVNVGEYLSKVKTVDIDDDDLPTILADGTYTSSDSEDFDYEQRLKFNSTVQFTFKSDNDYEKNNPVLMVYSNKKTGFMTYTLDFTKDAESEFDTTTTNMLKDFEDSTIEILGKDYDITRARNQTNQKIELTLMGGAIKDVMEQGQVKTLTIGDKDYEVEVTYIGTVNTVSKVKFKVNGQLTDAMAEDDTKKLSDGTIIGVREILEEEAGEVTADQVEFYLGAEKLKLTDSDSLSTTIQSDNVQINDEDVDDLYVAIGYTDTDEKGTIDKIMLIWQPDDEIFVTENTDVTMPGLEAFKISMGEFTKPAEEELLIEPNGDNSIELTANIESGSITFDVLSGNGSNWNQIGGEDYGENLTTSLLNAINFDLDSDEYFVISDPDAKESYVMEVTKIDENGVTLKDAINGNKYENKKNNTAFSIGGVTLTPSFILEAQDNVTFTAGGNGNFSKLYTKEGLTVFLPVNKNTSDTGKEEQNCEINQTGSTTKTTTCIISLVEEDKDENIGAGNRTNATVGFTSAKAAVTVSSQAALANANRYEIGDTDEFVGYITGPLATEVYYDTDPDQNTVRYIYHGGESYANIYVAEVESRISQEATSGATVCKVEVPPAKLDSEISDASAQNLIVVGGPCANTVASAVSGIPQTEPECYEQYTEGKAKIKLIEQTTGKVAMLVAGFSALDTRRATRVLMNYEDYELSDDEVEVAGTSLTDISISAPIAAEEEAAE